MMAAIRRFSSPNTANSDPFPLAESPETSGDSALFNIISNYSGVMVDFIQLKTTLQNTTKSTKYTK